MKQADLFGGESDPVRPLGVSPVKWRMGYHRADSKVRCCKTCEHAFGKAYHDKKYYKCSIIGCSASEATDIRLRDVCNHWEKEE